MQPGPPPPEISDDNPTIGIYVDREPGANGREVTVLLHNASFVELSDGSLVPGALLPLSKAIQLASQIMVAVGVALEGPE